MRSRRETTLTQNEFRAFIISSLSRLGQLDTNKAALEEIRSIVRENGQEDKVNILINQLQENSQNLTQLHRKEYIRLYGVIAESLEEKIIPFLPKILAHLSKKVREGDERLYDSISQAYGMIVHNTLHFIPDLPSSCNQLISIIKPIFVCLSGSNKSSQVGAALALSKVIQHAPIECLKFMLDKLTQRLLEILSMNSCKSHSQLLDSLVQLVLSVEQDFAPFTGETIPVLLQCLSNDDFNTRKQAVDSLYTLGAVVGQATLPYINDILSKLNKTRTDRSKPVRDSSLEALTLFKDLAPESIMQEEQKRPASGKAKVQEQDRTDSIFKRPANSAFFQAVPQQNFVEVLIPQDVKGVDENDESDQDMAKAQFIDIEEPVISNELQINRADDIQIESVPRTPSITDSDPEPQESRPSDSPWNQRASPQILDRLQFLEKQNLELMQSLHQVQYTTQKEVFTLNERLKALEKMMDAMASLFEAKISQIADNPKIAQLLNSNF